MKRKLLTLTIFSVALAAGLMIAFGKEASNDGLLLANVEALAHDEKPTLWFRVDEDCTWSGTGTKNSTISVTIKGSEYSVGTNSQGEWSYTVTGGRTRCTSGGHEQCTARYCD